MKSHKRYVEMRTEIDIEADAGYIYFKEISAGEIKKTISLNDSVNVDLDSEGRLLGIEILEVSKNLPKTGFGKLASN